MAIASPFGGYVFYFLLAGLRAFARWTANLFGAWGLVE